MYPQGDVLFIEEAQILNGVCSRDALCGRAKSRDITDVKCGRVPNFLVGPVRPTVSITEQQSMLFLRALITN
jgi:hypothetical protein